MKRFIILICTFLLGITGSNAQVSRADSIALVKKQQTIQKTEKRLEDRKMQLQKMENLLAEKTSVMNDALKQSQQSADENRSIAKKLSKDAQDKKLSKKAQSAAGKARSDAKKAREATSAVDSQKKDIAKLKRKIEKDEEQLKKLKQ